MLIKNDHSGSLSFAVLSAPQHYFRANMICWPVTAWSDLQIKQCTTTYYQINFTHESRENIPHISYWLIQPFPVSWISNWYLKKMLGNKYHIEVSSPSKEKFTRRWKFIYSLSCHFKTIRLYLIFKTQIKKINKTLICILTINQSLMTLKRHEGE